jgi:hypothetical protein
MTIPAKHTCIITNIQLTLEEHLPPEYEAVLDRINILTQELGERYAYKAYLERIADASKICLVVSGQGEQDTDRTSVHTKGLDGREFEESKERGRVWLDPFADTDPNRNGLLK